MRGSSARRAGFKLPLDGGARGRVDGIDVVVLATKVDGAFFHQTVE